MQEQPIGQGSESPIRVELNLLRPLLILVLIVGLVWLLSSLQTILTQIFVALGIAYVLDPVVDRIERLVRSRALAVVILLVPLLGVLSLIGIFLLPRLLDEIGTFASKLPGMFQAAAAWSLSLLTNTLKIEIPGSLSELMERFGAEIKEAAPSVLVALRAAATGLYSGGAGVFRTASGVLIIPVFSVYLLYDFDRILGYLRGLLPRAYEPMVVDHLREIDQAVASFFRGQLTVCLILGSLYSIGFSLIGLKMALLIGLATGALAIVPYAGALAGLLTALSSALLWFDSWWQVLGVLLIFGGVQTLDGLLLTPRVLGRSVNLSPVLIIISLMVGGKLLGLAGVLIAVPTAACVRVLGHSLIRWYVASDFYNAGPRPPSEALARAGEALPADRAEGTGPPPGPDPSEAAEQQAAEDLHGDPGRQDDEGEAQSEELEPEQAKGSE